MYFVNSMVNILAQNEAPRYLEEGGCERAAQGSPSQLHDFQSGAPPWLGHHYMVRVLYIPYLI